MSGEFKQTLTVAHVIDHDDENGSIQVQLAGDPEGYVLTARSWIGAKPDVGSQVLVAHVSRGLLVCLGEMQRFDQR